MPSEEDYLRDVEKCMSLGIKAYKLHCRSDPGIFVSIREKVGRDFVLMADPVADWSVAEAYRFGKVLEDNDYYWLEEPFRDYNINSYITLKEKLSIPIAGTEALFGGPWAVAQYIAAKAVDIVRADVSWKAGITGTLKTAHLADAHGLHCEVHMTGMGPMDIANLHVSCAIKNCEYFEISASHPAFQFPMKGPLPLTSDGNIVAPIKPGLGIDIDWDTVDDSTYKKFDIG
jgi:L-alanine-DL-glutamate epimerase-like enolase superfamily enzyme